MTIRVNDLYAEEALKLLSTLPEEAITIDPKPWYADEVKRRIEEYRAGEMETYPVDQAFWDEMDEYIDTVA
ncbi:MAG: addiction module protein [Sulfuricurvum sp.]|nr:addiction module protein [Sulfuricurvum sp.]